MRTGQLVQPSAGAGLQLVLGDRHEGAPRRVVVATIEEALAVLAGGRVDELAVETSGEAAVALLGAMAQRGVWPRGGINLCAVDAATAHRVGELAADGGFVASATEPAMLRRLVIPAPLARRPLLLLDIDGVLCPLGRSASGLREAFAGGQFVRYDSALAVSLRQLRGCFELVWATMWEHAANECVAPLFELPWLPVIRFDDGFTLGETWELAAIQRFVGNRPCAWVDDVIGDDAHRWAKDRSVPTLLLDIDPSTGLAAPHVERLLAFAAHLGDQAHGAAGR